MSPKIFRSAGKENPASEPSAAKDRQQPQKEETLEVLLERCERIELKLRKLQQQAKRADWDLSPAERIAKWGHRSYVGGLDLETWYGIGKHQML